MTELRTPLKRARGLGSAKEGVKDWWQTRLTSLALIPLTLWFIYQIIGLNNIYKVADGNRADAGFEAARAWVAEPVNTVLLILFAAINFLHAASGMQVVLEDYVHREGRKLVFIYGVKGVLFCAGAATIFSILRIAFAHG